MSESLSWNEQFKIGKEGESLFAVEYSHLKPKESVVRSFDFSIEGGKLNNSSNSYVVEAGPLEYKRDKYNITKTPNFFIEVSTVKEKNGKVISEFDGGVSRAIKDNVKYFVYGFSENRVYFWFVNLKLAQKTIGEYVDKNKCKLISIVNPQFENGERLIGYGFKIPREVLLKNGSIIEDNRSEIQLQG